MPTLIRFLVFLLILGGLILAGMLALTILVEPDEEQVRVRIPTRELFENENAGTGTSAQQSDQQDGEAALETPDAE